MKIFDDKGFEKYDLAYLKLLQEDDRFVRLLTRYRNVFELPADGLTFDNNNFEKIKSKNKRFFSELRLSALRLLMLYDLPFYWISTMEFLIVFDTAFPPDRKLYPPLTFEIRSKRGWPKSVTLALTTEERTSITNIQKVIQQNSAKILKALHFLPKPPQPRKWHLELHKDIRFRHRMKKMSYAKISKDLESTLPYESGYDVIGAEAYRFEKEIEKLIKRKGTLEDVATDLILEGHI